MFSATPRPRHHRCLAHMGRLTYKLMISYRSANRGGPGAAVPTAGEIINPSADRSSQIQCPLVERLGHTSSLENARPSLCEASLKKEHYSMLYTCLPESVLVLHLR